MSPNRQRHSAIARRAQAIQAELRLLREKSWRQFLDEPLMEFRPQPVADREVSSPICGPDMKTVQWRRE